MFRLCRFCSDFADLSSDLLDLFSDIADLSLDFAGFDLDDFEFLVPTRIDSDLLCLDIKPRLDP